MVKKIMESRLIKVSMIALLLLFVIKIISFGMIAWLANMIGSESLSTDQVFALSKLADLLSVNISTATLAIITALIARYGAREATSNLNKNGVQK